MEKVQGVQLYDHLAKLDKKPWIQFTSDLVKMEKRLTDAELSDLGSLYFERDLPPGTKKTSMRLIDKNGTNVNHDGICIGPSVDRRFWRGERTNMQTDRGPWDSLPDYTRAIIDCEIQWLRSHTKPHPKDSPLFRSDRENDPQTHIHLLEKYALVVDALVPRADLCTFRLWHPDLHLSNILISGPDLGNVAGVIDWQEACIDPLLVVGSVPDFMGYPGGKYVPQTSPPGKATPDPVLPEIFDELDAIEKQKAEAELKAAKRYQG